MAVHPHISLGVKVIAETFHSVHDAHTQRAPIYSSSQSLYIPPSMPVLLLCGSRQAPCHIYITMSHPSPEAAGFFLSKQTVTQESVPRLALNPLCGRGLSELLVLLPLYLPRAGIIGVSHPSLPQPLLASTDSSLQTQNWKNVRCIGCGGTPGKERQVDL